MFCTEGNANDDAKEKARHDGLATLEFGASKSTEILAAEVQRATVMNHDVESLLRAEGCLLGQLAGDSLGSLVEWQPPSEILRRYPNRVRELADGGVWGTIAGQPTDDSEMALMLARMLVKERRYDVEEARKAYVFWLDSPAFACGGTTLAGLRGNPKMESQANGALMRISPLGIFCANSDLETTSELAQRDASLTHPHPICRQANALFAMSIAQRFPA